MSRSDNVSTAALVISIVAGFISIMSTLVASLMSIAYKALSISYEKLRMECVTFGRASHILKKFKTSDSIE